MSIALLLAGAVAITAAVVARSSGTHPVTPAMLASAKGQAGRPLSAPEAEGSDGRRHAPEAVAAARPVVLVFIERACPCSEAAEPYFHRLHAGYGGRAAFFGVINGDRAEAEEWAKGHRVPYPVLADPDHRIIDACAAERSVWVALVAPGGTVETIWPGYSSAMLADLGARLARHTGLAEVPIDTKGAPAEMLSGCQF